MQSCLGGLRVLAGNPCQDFHQIHPPLELLRSHLSSAALSLENPPRYQLQVTLFTPIPHKYSSDLAIFRGATTNILLVGSGKYPLDVPLVCRS